MNEMNTMNTNNRNYNDRDYDNRAYNSRDYDNRYYDDNMYGYRGNYREEYRDNYRDGYREDYRRDYDRRGGKINNRNYRNYREQDYYEELEIVAEDMREIYRKIEDIGEMAHNQQDKNMLMKIAQKEKENYTYMKQMMEK